MSYSQNKEDQAILDHFNGHKGLLLEIGANDGKTLSNSLLLIQNGWEAILVEPADSAFDRLADLHKGNDKVCLIKAAIADYSGEAVLHESGEHLKNGDTGLLSTLKESEKNRWLTEQFKETTTTVMSFSDLKAMFAENPDYISIDAEGYDWEILKQIDLSAVRCVCVEHNGIEIEKYLDYCQGFGMKELLRNGENLVMVK